MADQESRFINRELSWIEFNQRVLEEAQDAAVPLLERLNFLAIASSNLDEFFMVRVGALQMLIEQNVTRRDPAGLLPTQQIEAVSARVRIMVDAQYATYGDAVEPALAEAGLQRVRPGAMTEQQQEYVERLFEEKITAVVTPMGVDARARFPLLRNLVLNLAVRLKPHRKKGAPRFAIVPIGTTLNRFITLPSDSGYRFILLEDVLEAYVGRLFPGETVVECVSFRITRNADMGIREDDASDLLVEMEALLGARRTSDCVRLEIEERVTNILLRFLSARLHVDQRDVYRIRGPLDLAQFRQIAGTDGFQALKHEPWPPRASPLVDPKSSMFDILAARDVLLVHPFESFEPVLRLIQAAAEDPDVLAIKLVLYRTSRNSPIIAALRTAAESGKYVTALVELKARFDEARNIRWARQLEEAGVQVIYGVKGLKTHAKVCIIVRRETRGVVRYLHFGTGNYNEMTARLYTDVSLMTSDEDLGRDASAFFNAICGYSEPQPFLRLVSAPLNLRRKLLELIEDETIRKGHGQQGLILAKLNSLVDAEIIDAFYRASQAGVRIELNVRGICCLRPGVPGLSENIRVVSVVDRFLEHSRVFYFRAGGEERMFISSADWMPRNLDRRVELMIPVENAAARDRLLRLLRTCLKDTVKGRRLLPSGEYERLAAKAGKLRCQEAMYREACETIAAKRHARRTVFEPHRSPDAEE